MVFHSAMANNPLADFIRERSPIDSRQAAKLLGLSERSVGRMIAAGSLQAARLGDAPNAPYVFDLGDVLLAHARRVLRRRDELDELDDVDDDDAGLFDRAEATG